MSVAWKALYAKDPARWQARSKKWVSDNWEKARRVQKSSELKGKYGISLEEKEKMAAAQEFKCAICGEVKPLEVDHDHTTGKVRGLLCTCCNRAFGLMKEAVPTFQGAIAYAFKHKNPS
jgi:hypothetical protein